MPQGSDMRAVVQTIGTCLLIVACVSRKNPILVLPTAEVGVHLAGRIVNDTGGPIGGLVDLKPIRRSGDTTTTRRRVAGDGRFRFDSLPPGPYALTSRSLGYRVRQDTFALSAVPGLDVQVTLHLQTLCFDLCPADPRLIQAALAQKSRWQCDHDSKSLAYMRDRWSHFLADSLVRSYLGHQLNSNQIHRELRLVRRDADCRRLAVAAYDAPTTLAFSVFRWRDYWLVSDPDFDEAILTDESFRRVTGSEGGGFAYWFATALISDTEYDLFATALRQYGTTLLEPDSTTWFHCPPESDEPCGWRQATPEPPGWAAFMAANRTAARISAEALRRRGFVIAPRDYQGDPHACGGPLHVVISRAGFSNDSTDAVIHLSVNTGAGPYPGCGWAAGGMYLYHRGKDGIWRLSKTYDNWTT
jgi:hypothetical protein